MKVYVTIWADGDDEGKIRLLDLPVHKHNKEFVELEFALLKIGEGAFTDEKEALADAESRREKRIAAHQRAIERLQKMKFSVVEE